MALNIGNKIFRNLPEQVAKNQSDILELARAIGQPSKVVYIETNDVSGTLSDNDFDYLKQHDDALICIKRATEFIYYGKYKETFSNMNMTYISLTILSSDLSVNEKINNEILSIDIYTKAWAIELKEIAFYSKDQADANFPKIYYASDEITNLSATDIKAIVDGGFKLVIGTSNENMVGYVLQGYIGITDKYYLNILLNYDPALFKLNYVVDGDTVSQTSHEFVSDNHYGNVIIDGNLQTTTLKQTQANYLHEFEVLPDDETNFETFGEQYCRFEVVNGELHIIICATFHNKDTNTHNTNLKYQNITNIPAAIGEKIIDMGGKKLTEIPSGGISNVIRISPCGAYSTTTGIALYPCRIEHSGQNQITIYQPNGMNVDADGYIMFSIEANLSIMPSSE